MRRPRRPLGLVLALPLLSCAALRDGRLVSGSDLARIAWKTTEGAANSVETMKLCDDQAELDKYELNSEQEYYTGRAVTAQMLTKSYGGAPLLEPQAPMAAYVNQVGQTVAAGAESVRDEARGQAHRIRPVPDRPQPARGYHFIVVDTPLVDAHGLLGGFVIVTSGMVRLAEDEDELAGVLAHEIAHVQRGHGMEVVKHELCRASRKEKGKDFATPMAELVGSSGPLGAAVGLLGGLTSSLTEAILSSGFGKEVELEADAQAVHYASAAGYRPGGIADLLPRAPREQRKILKSFRSTHPEPELRVKALVVELGAHPSAEPDARALALRKSRFERTLGPVAIQGGRVGPRVAARP